MTPHQFIEKWKNHALTERAAAQEHFIDLCRLFDHPTPAEDDPAGERFTFEKGASVLGAGGGWADVWKKGFFAFEYKKRRRNLDEAMVQLARYAAALEHPPLLIACDTIRFQILTTWTNLETKKYEFELEDLADPAKFALLRAAFHDPEALKPVRTRAQLTRDAADKFQAISDALQHRHPDREAVAHFINQLVFCFFADSVKLLPEGLLKKLLRTAEKRPKKAKDYFDKLFEQMEKGGEFDLTEIAWFNGGLFDGRRALPLEYSDIGLLFAASSLDWSLIDPIIFGTLFERFLDPDKRAQIGAHYTDADKIMMIVEPVVMRPLRREWEAVRAEIGAVMTPAGEATPAARDSRRAHEKKIVAAREKAAGLRDDFIARLAALRILDPACGSGNFLYLALQSVKDLEFQAISHCETLGLDRPTLRVGPEILRGIEINPFAAELARTTIWIGDIQWGIRNAIYTRPEPILRKLDAIECRDAILWTPPSDTPPSSRAERSNEGEGREMARPAQWPEVDFIVGNPPFLGGKLLRKGLGDSYVDSLFAAYAGRVPAEADLVCYWFERAGAAVAAGQAKACGLVATNSIRGGANRRVLEPLELFEAWGDEPWTIDGAAVRVSLVCFGAGEGKRLDGKDVSAINADLSASCDLTKAKGLMENKDCASNGVSKKGKFEVHGNIARYWIVSEFNANNRSNSEVLQPWRNGDHLMNSQFADLWIINFSEFSEKDAAYFDAPFTYVREYVKPFRDKSRSSLESRNWWKLARPASGLFARTKDLGRFIVVAEVSKYKIFSWMMKGICPDKNLVVVSRDDDVTFGILHSRFHEAWALRLGTSLEDRPRYTPTTTFETFPFPEGLTPNIPAADYAADPRAIRIAAAAKKLDEMRNAWLNPPDLVDIVPEVVPGYPDRILPKTVEAAAKLKERTLTNLYNQRPQWLAALHDDLDRAVAAAYGWDEDIATEDALEKLLALNLERAGAGR